jgi:hypothetical protein
VAHSSTQIKGGDFIALNRDHVTMAVNVKLFAVHDFILYEIGTDTTIITHVDFNTESLCVKLCLESYDAILIEDKFIIDIDNTEDRVDRLDFVHDCFLRVS